MPPAAPSAWTLARVAGRLLLLQAAWNPKGMQNLGLAYALDPALARLWPDADAHRAAVQRHLGPFNTHPYLGAAIAGGVLCHELRAARGEEAPEASVAFRQALMGPLAALGDGFFWLSLRPALGALAAVLAVAVGGWAALGFVVLYGALTLGLRARWLKLGLALGDGLLEPIARERLADRGTPLRALAAAAAGAFVPALAGWGKLGATTAVAWAAVAVGVAAVLLLARRVSVYALLYMAAALGLLWGWYVAP